MTMDNLNPKTTLKIDQELQEIVPRFLQNKADEIEIIRTKLQVDDFEAISMIGHSMKGSGAGYGFLRITEIGRAIEAAAKTADKTNILLQIGALQSYLDQIDIVYVEEV